jgi:hypothetical protein
MSSCPSRPSPLHPFLCSSPSQPPCFPLLLAHLTPPLLWSRSVVEVTIVGNVCSTVSLVSRSMSSLGTCRHARLSSMCFPDHRHSSAPFVPHHRAAKVHLRCRRRSSVRVGHGALASSLHIALHACSRPPRGSPQAPSRHRCPPCVVSAVGAPSAPEHRLRRHDRARPHRPPKDRPCMQTSPSEPHQASPPLRDALAVPGDPPESPG